nr:hypothetical protein [Piscinibacter sp.]
AVGEGGVVIGAAFVSMAILEARPRDTGTNRMPRLPEGDPQARMIAARFRTTEPMPFRSTTGARSLPFHDESLGAACGPSPQQREREITRA